MTSCQPVQKTVRCRSDSSITCSPPCLTCSGRQDMQRFPSRTYRDGLAARLHDDINLSLLAIMAVVAAWSMWRCGPPDIRRNRHDSSLVFNCGMSGRSMECRDRRRLCPKLSHRDTRVIDTVRLFHVVGLWCLRRSLRCRRHAACRFPCRIGVVRVLGVFGAGPPSSLLAM